MRATCTCGTEFEARNPRAKFCSDRCRKRAQRRPAANLVEIPASSGDMGPIEASTLAQLEQIGRESTPLGTLALTHARRLDDSRGETASGVASLSKEWRSALAEATKGAAGATAPEVLRDELAARRARQGA